MAQIPHYENLKQKFIGKEIVFISVCIDYSKSKGEKFLKNSPQLTGIQLWLGPQKQPYYYSLMDYQTMMSADPISANSNEMKKSLENGTNVFDGVFGNFVIIHKEGKIVENWLLPSDNHKMENILNQIIINIIIILYIAL